MIPPAFHNVRRENNINDIKKWKIYKIKRKYFEEELKEEDIETTRPVIVLKTLGSNMIFIPITSRRSKGQEEFHFELENRISESYEKSYAKLSSINTINISKGKYIKRVRYRNSNQKVTISDRKKIRDKLKELYL